MVLYQNSTKKSFDLSITHPNIHQLRVMKLLNTVANAATIQSSVLSHGLCINSDSKTFF